jgi:hypothetical protein
VAPRECRGKRGVGQDVAGEERCWAIGMGARTSAQPGDECGGSA